MKIHVLRLKNLNSLREEVQIDFTLPPFSGTSLFAITGPTGSGKTTLLDAITLALYGKVARYGNESNPENIMSRHTGECRAEVEFSCARGHFRAVWERRRAHGRADGQIQPPKRILARLPHGEILAEKQSEVQVQIDALTGLDYERFLRSVLLAQGDFAAFLRASASERSTILQKITGTSLYQEISRACYRRWEESRQACETLRTQLAALQPAELGLDALRSQLAAAQKEENVRRLQEQALSERLAAARRWQEIEEELCRRQIEEEKWKKEQEQAAPVLAKLAAHERVWRFTPQFTRCESLQQNIQAKLKHLTELEAALPAKQAAQQDARVAFLQAETSLACEEQRRRELLPLWEEVLLYDQDIQVAQQACANTREGTLRATNEEQRLRQERDRDLAAEHLLATEAAQLETWLSEKQKDRELEQLLPDLERRNQLWESARRQAEICRQNLSRLSPQQEKLAAAVHQQEAHLQQERKNRAQRQAALEQITAEIQRLLGPLDPAAMDQLRQQTQQRAVDLAKALEVRALVSRSRQLNEKNRQKISAVSQSLAACREKLTTATDLYQQLQKTLEASEAALRFAEKVQSLEEQRRSLRPGQPCPLCGSTEHPFVTREVMGEDSLAAMRQRAHQAHQQAKEKEQALLALKQEVALREADAARLQEEAAEERRQEEAAWAAWKTMAVRLSLPKEIEPEALSKLQEQAQSAQQESQTVWQRLQDLMALERRETAELARLDQALQKSTEQLHQAQLAAAQAAEKLRQHQANLKAAENDAEARCEELDRCLSPWVTDWQKAQPPALEQLRQRLQLFSQKSARALLVRSNREILQERLRRYEVQLQTSAENLRQARESEAKATEALQQLRTRRFQLFADQEVNKAREQMERKLDDLRKARDSQNARLAQKAQEVRLLEAEMEQCRKDLRSLSTDLDNLMSALLPLLQQAGFPDLPSARSALLSSAEISTLHDQRNRLEEMRIHLLAREQELRAQARTLPATAAADAAQSHELARQREEAEAAWQAATKQLGILQEAIRREETLQQTRAGLMAQLTSQEKEHRRWSSLKQLIGQADGQLFARFAQTLTMERLALLASRHLQQLSPRYRLQRLVEAENTDSLDLVVVDLYQGGVSRPLRSLSGGETFLVSLALALGLSELARGQTAIESLFIDEGFGSLDEAALDTAMQALENIHAAGRTIGIISHLASLRERLTTQIRLSRKPDGTSTVKIHSGGEIEREAPLTDTNHSNSSTISFAEEPLNFMYR